MILFYTDCTPWWHPCAVYTVITWQALRSLGLAGWLTANQLVWWCTNWTICWVILPIVTIACTLYICTKYLLIGCWKTLTPPLLLFVILWFTPTFSPWKDHKVCEQPIIKLPIRAEHTGRKQCSAFTLCACDFPTTESKLWRVFKLKISYYRFWWKKFALLMKWDSSVEVLQR